ncbi:MAG: hypothetical protein ACTSXA_08860 [Candidatus Heimdallarchaeota archaeon]
MQKKNLMKFAIFMFAVMLMVGWNYVSFRVVAQGDFNLFDNPATTNSLPEITNPTTQVDYIVDPPLGNSTSLPGFTTVFSLMALNLPVQIIFVFLAEVLMGTALKLDPKRLNIKRLGIMIGSALALTVVVSLVYYLMVWPAMHDLAIHNQGTFNDPITEEQNILQYGGAQTFFTKGVDILLLVFAMIFIMGFNFLAFKFIQRLTYLTSALSIAYPLVYFPIFWSALSKEITEKFFMEKTGTHLTFTLIVSLFFILGSVLLLIWQLTLIGTPVAEIE